MQTEIANNKQALNELLALVEKRNTTRKGTSLQIHPQTRPVSSPTKPLDRHLRVESSPKITTRREIDDLVEVRDKVNELLNMLNTKID